MAEMNARERLDIERQQRAQLSLGEVAHALYGELRVACGLRVQGRDRCLALLRPDLERLDFRLVEGPAELAYRRIAALADRGDNRLDGSCDIGVIVSLRPPRTLEMPKLRSDVGAELHGAHPPRKVSMMATGARALQAVPAQY